MISAEFSHSVVRKALPVFAVLCAVLICGFFSSCSEEQVYEIPQAALDDESSGAVEVQVLSVRSLIETTDVTDGGSVDVPRLCSTTLEAQCNPDTIEIGIDCGMDWMCGIDPCLCGAPDAWGFCACNGLYEVKPKMTWASSNENVARVEEQGGQMVLVAVGDGEATLTGVASLPHYASSNEVTFSVHVGDLTTSDAALIAIIIGIIVVVLIIVILVIRYVRRRRMRQAQ